MKQLCVLAAVILLVCGNDSRAADPAPVSFSSSIAPILLNKCLACHGPKKAEGGYRVDTYQELVKAGDSGESPVPTTPEHTGELLRRITSSDASERMPADDDPLTPAEIDLFQKWMAAGGKFDGENSGQALALVIPPVQYADPPEVYRHPIPLTAIAFSPDGKFVIAGGYYELTVWNTEDGKLVRRIRNLGQRIYSLAFSADGKTLAVGCGEPGRSGEVRLVDFSTGQINGVIARVNDVVLDVAYRPASNELAVASADGTIRIVNVETRQDLQTLTSHADWVTAVTWSDDGTRLASASRDKSVKVYDGTTRELLSSYLGHGAGTKGVSILPENKHVVSVGIDHKLHRWEIEGAKKIAEVALGGEAYKLARHGNNLLIPCADKRILQVDLTSNAVVKEYKGHTGGVLSACFQPAAVAADGVPLMVSGAFDGEVRLWNSADAAQIRQWVAKP